MNNLNLIRLHCKDTLKYAKKNILLTPDILLSYTPFNFVLNNSKLLNMNREKIKSFSIIGIAIRTTNENAQASRDIPVLWNKFMSEGTIEKITNKIDQTIYCVYTDYEKDHTKPYTTIIGCKVNNLNNIPEGMVGKKIEETYYIKFTAKGNISKGIVFNEWIKIWNSGILRTYQSDFEVYGENAKNPEKAAIDIYISTK